MRRVGVRQLLVAAMGVCVLAVSATTARAADHSKQWVIGPYLFYANYDNDSLIRDSQGPGIRGGYQFNKTSLAEFQIDSSKADDVHRGTSRTYDIHKWVAHYVANLKVKKPDSKLKPFMLVGLGKMNYKASDAGSDSSTIWQIGGGLHVLFTPRVALRLDGQIWHFHGDPVLVPEHGFFAIDYTAGVSFFIGKGK